MNILMAASQESCLENKAGFLTVAVKYRECYTLWGKRACIRTLQSFNIYITINLTKSIYCIAWDKRKEIVRCLYETGKKAYFL